MATQTVTNIPFSVQFFDLTNFNTVTEPKVNATLTSGVTFPLNGISAANSRFYYKIVDFNGDTVYQNEAFDSTPVYSNPDVLGAAPTTWANANPEAPNDSNNNVLQGEYTFTVLQRDDSQGITDLFTRDVVFDFQYDRPDENVEKSVNIFTPSIVLTDSTSYGVVNPLDDSVVNPSLTRAWKFYYPSILDLSPVTGSGSSLTVYKFYPGHQEYKLTVDAVYTYDMTSSIDEGVVTDSIVTTDDIPIPKDLCSLFCCVSEVEDRYWESRGTSAMPSAAADFNAVGAYMAMINSALLCGNTETVGTWMEHVQEIANCDDDCSCDDDGLPRQITGFGNPTITEKIEELADGSTTVFPTDVANQNILKNKDWDLGEIAISVEGVIVGKLGNSTATFDSTTGKFTLNWTPSTGVNVTIQIFK